MIHITTFQRKTRVLSCKGTSTDNHYSLVFSFISSFAIVWPLPIRRLWSVFVVPSLLRTPANESLRLQERLKRFFLQDALIHHPLP